MSDIADVQYWRILKRGATRFGENIKEGDTIRLCWSFKDQKVGFRDFQDDVFGRRRNQIPPELDSGVLFLKLPWPRFESLQTPGEDGRPMPNAMVMSTGAEEADSLMQLMNLPAMNRGGPGSSTYAVQDVAFRIDTVANDGKGDVDDYMLKGIDQGDKPAWLRSWDTTLMLQSQQQQLVYAMFFLGM